jgi:thioredoxin-like negative regulator of GroEL
VANEYKGRVKVAFIDVDKEKELAQSCRARDVPHVVIFSGGEKVSDHGGHCQKDVITKILDKVLA